MTRLFWVRGARPETFTKSYRDIGRKLGLAGCDDLEAETSEPLCIWLSDSANGNWFMVIDNVEDEAVFSASSGSAFPTKPTFASRFHVYQRYLPQVQHGTILVTSRNRVAARDVVNEASGIVIVDRLPREDASDLLYRKLPSDISPEKDFVSLLNLLEDLPLAITQAAAYISRSARMTVSRYLALFQLDQMRYLESPQMTSERTLEARIKISLTPCSRHGTFLLTILKRKLRMQLRLYAS